MEKILQGIQDSKRSRNCNSRSNFSSSLKITEDHHLRSHQARQFAERTNSPRASSVSTDPEIDQATNAAADADFLSPPDMNSATATASLGFVQFFAALRSCAHKLMARDSLLQISIHEEDGAVSKFLENYMYPLAAHLMESLVSTPIARRKSIRRMLVPHSEAGGKSSRTLRILRRNRKLFSRIYEFYKVDPDKGKRATKSIKD